jgi:hypothetical protein
LIEPDVRQFLGDRLGRQAAGILTEEDQHGIPGHEARQGEVARGRHQDDEDVLRYPDGESPEHPVPPAATPFGHGAARRIAQGGRPPTSVR